MGLKVLSGEPFFLVGENQSPDEWRYGGNLGKNCWTIHSMEKKSEEEEYRELYDLSIIYL
jgi:hypothetical protein